MEKQNVQPASRKGLSEDAYGNGPSRLRNPELQPSPQRDNAGTTPAPSVEAPTAQPSVFTTAPALVTSAAPVMLYGPRYSSNDKPKARQTVRLG